MSRRRVPVPRSVSRLSVSRTAVCKLLGLAGLAGVAASGAVLARSERRRRAYTPDEVRARLRDRAAVPPDRSTGS